MNRYHVLIVDSNDAERRTLRDALGRAHMALDVSEASGADDALTMLATGRVECALVAFDSPTSDGIELLREIARRRIDVPVIGLTRQEREGFGVELMKAGVVDYLPVDRATPDRLEGSLRHAAAIADSRRLQRDLLAREHEARREAEAASRAKDQFLATVSHELRTPIGAIVGWADLMRTGGLGQAATDRALEVIARNARLLARQIDDLLDVSRINAGTMTLARKPVDLDVLVDTVIDSARPAARAKGVRLRAHTSGRPVPVTGDVDRLTQVMTHLVANAIKFSNPDGTVSVASVFRHGRVRLTVTDDGAGISVGFLPHVFSAFKQADNSSARRHGGLGLGLSIVKRLVNLHGGSIKVSSKGAGTGATFTVDLPTSVGDAPARARHEASGRLAGLRVLVVDDDEDALSLIAALLSREGAHVATASSAREALVLCGRFDADVLLSDLSMPDEDGFWLIKQIRREEARRHAPHRPAAAITALTLEEDKAKALDAGFDVHVAKPVSPGVLATVVEQLAEGRTPA